MKKILSERNIAALLFVLVIVAFSFAHEDSKKRSSDYNVSASSSAEKPTASLTVNNSKEKNN